MSVTMSMFRLIQPSGATPNSASCRRNGIAASTTRLTATRTGSAYHSSRNAPYRSTALESALLIGAPSEQSLRFHEQHEDEGEEYHDLVRGAVEVRRAEHLDEADDEPADERAGEGAEPPQHDHDERVYQVLVAERRRERLEQRDDAAREPRQRGA